MVGLWDGQVCGLVRDMLRANLCSLLPFQPSLEVRWGIVEAWSLFLSTLSRPFCWKDGHEAWPLFRSFRPSSCVGLPLTQSEVLPLRSVGWPNYRMDRPEALPLLCSSIPSNSLVFLSWLLGTILRKVRSVQKLSNEQEVLFSGWSPP